MTLDFEREVERLIAQDILANQSFLVTELLGKGLVEWEEVENLYDDNAEDRDIFEWWLVSEWIADKLSGFAEPILRTDYGTWWGRTCTGQAIKLDGTIQKIIKSLND